MLRLFKIARMVKIFQMIEQSVIYKNFQLE